MPQDVGFGHEGVKRHERPSRITRPLSGGSFELALRNLESVLVQRRSRAAASTSVNTAKLADCLPASSERHSRALDLIFNIGPQLHCGHLVIPVSIAC